VTVCIAAIATGLVKGDKKDKEIPVIVGASDRMVSALDIGYERPQSKISRITPFIVALSAGNDAVQAEVLSRTESHFQTELANNPRWFPVEEVADKYSQNLVTYLREAIERTILEPVGLNWDTYMSSHPDRHPLWFEERRKEVFEDYPPSTETIVAGVDESGAHIFEVNRDGLVVRRDRAAFATIGSGYRHAESQFMFEGHSPSKSYPDTLFLTYVAKRRAEVAPGVGKDTDLFTISLRGGYVELQEELDTFKKVYDSILRKGEEERAELKLKILDTMEKTQELRKAKYTKLWEEKIRKWTDSGKLEDSPFFQPPKNTPTK